jgi:hypothetical protein
MKVVLNTITLTSKPLHFNIEYKIVHKQEVITWFGTVSIGTVSTSITSSSLSVFSSTFISLSSELSSSYNDIKTLEN